MATLHHVRSFSNSKSELDCTPRLANLKITERGAKLHDLLKAEMEVRQVRQKSLRFLDAISGNLESGAEQQYIEKALMEIIESTKENVESMKRQVTDLENDEKTLAEKIKRKQADLERNKKRLASLQHVRPAFMDEYEKLERDLQKQYTIYLEKFRNLDYLEHGKRSALARLLQKKKKRKKEKEFGRTTITIECIINTSNCRT